MLAFVLTRGLSSGPIDVTGPLTALLVLQASAYTTMRMGLVRVGAVFTGIAVAIALSQWAGLHWWSLGLAVGTAITLARMLRLGEQALEAPISAMLILVTSEQSLAVETRIMNTLIGAGVGVAFAVLLPPSMPIRSASHGVRRVGALSAASLRRAAASIERKPITRNEVTTWLNQLYEVGSQLSSTSKLVREVGDARKFNPRAIGTADVEPVLRSGLDILERTTVWVRNLYRAIEREAPEAPQDAVTTGEQAAIATDTYGADIREIFAVVLNDVADTLEGFGELVAAEAIGEEEQVTANYAHCLEILRETRAILTELMFVDAREHPSLWLLRGTILHTIDQMLDQLALDRRARSRDEWKQMYAGRRLTQGQLLNRDTLAALRQRQVPSLRLRRVQPPGKL